VSKRGEKVAANRAESWLLMYVLVSLEKWVFFLLFVVLICVDSTYISGSELWHYGQKALAFFAGLP